MTGGLILGAVGLGVGLMATGMLINMTNENVNRLIDKGKGRKPRKVKPIVTGFDKGMRMPKAKGRKSSRADNNPFSAKNINKQFKYY